MRLPASPPNCGRRLATQRLILSSTMQPAPFYVSAEWAKARNQALHDANYSCERCHASLIGRGREAHVHHRKPYKVAPALATEPLNLMALCLSCHNAVHHEMQRPSIACDVDGNPVDERHPWNIPSP